MFNPIKRRRNLKLLDLFCGAGGTSRGYYYSGFDVTGIDIKPQPRYPYKFYKVNAILFLERRWKEFDVIHASPPCQKFSLNTLQWIHKNIEHPNLIDPIRNFLISINKPYIIENVVRSPLNNTVMLCGSMFGLNIRRHRLFETNFYVKQPECNHSSQKYVIRVYGSPGGSSTRDNIKFGSTEDWKKAMGIDWMTYRELALAIPPAYTSYIAKYIKP